MSASSFVGLLVFAVLVTVAGMIYMDVVPTGVSAQDNASPAAQGGRGRGGAVGQLPGGGGRGRGGPPVILGPPAGVEPLPLDLFASSDRDRGLTVFLQPELHGELPEVHVGRKGRAERAAFGIAGDLLDIPCVREAFEPVDRH